MASNRVKGITVEIEGDVTGLNSALKDVDKSLKDTQTQLKDVNKLLKIDPGNLELLRQKGDLLKNSIKDTKDRLNQLKEAYKNIKADSPEELKRKQNDLKREIIATEQSLDSLTKQYREFGSVAKQALTEAGSKMKETGDKMMSVGGKMTATVTTPIVAGFALAANAASDYEENLNKLDVAFGEYSDKVRSFTDNAQIDYGLSMKDASDSAAAFGALAKGIGLSEEQAADMSVELTKLSADLGSYFNTDIESSAAALEGIFTGNATSLKKFGVVMTDTNLKEFAKELGMTDKQFAKLGSEDKTLLRFQYVMAQTSDAQGDFARTNDGMANSTKSMQAALSDLATVVGGQLLPMIVPVVQKITEVISKLSQLDEGVLHTIVVVGGIVAAIGPVVTIIGAIIKGAGLLTTAIGFLMSPMGLVVAAIAAVIAIGVALYKNWDTISAKAKELWEKLKTDFNQIKDFITEKIEALIEKFINFKQAIVDAFSFENLKGKISGLFTKIGGFLGASSGGFSSGGFMSGGYASGGSIVLYNTFNVSASNFDRQTAYALADMITDRVNENLGRMI